MNNSRYEDNCSKIEQPSRKLGAKNAGVDLPSSENPTLITFSFTNATLYVHAKKVIDMGHVTGGRGVI